MIIELLEAGWLAVVDYVALHVLTCLVPAFLLAGAMVSFISKEAIMYYLGAAQSKLKAFSLAAGGSFFVAACSCTVIPVGSGLYYGGASIGATFILLWVAPSSNILSLIYTGSLLGWQIVVARLVSSLVLASIVGWVMTWLFRAEEKTRMEDRAAQAKSTSGQTVGKVISRPDVILLGLILVSLLAPNYLIQKGPFWQKVAVWVVATVIAGGYAWKVKTRDQIKDWLRETWWFVRTIFPLLLVGVFVVGIVGKLLPEEWVRRWLGGSGLRASFVSTLIGSVTYFATLTEAPFVDTLMKMGMGKGPAVALLLTGPGLSLPSWLAIGKVFGVNKAIAYVTTIIITGTIAGWVVGRIL